MNITEENRHGSAYDRGRSDSYYSRPAEPHKFESTPYNSPKITRENMSESEISLYFKGYKDNEEDENKKEW